MTHRARLPIRWRLFLAFGASLVAVITGLSLFVYRQTGDDLLSAIDAGLSSRAALLASNAADDGPSQVSMQLVPIDGEPAFAQLASASSGQMFRSVAGISRWRLLPAREIRAVRRRSFYQRSIPGIAGVARVIAVPAVSRQGRLIVMVGVSLGRRQGQLLHLAATLAVAGAAALCLLSAGAWLVIAGALRPVERMRRQAAEISASGLGLRLSPAGGGDEIALLGATLNQMLDRIEESVASERRLVDRASHELRTPLAIQRMDLDVAVSGPQTIEELATALASVSEENAHLTRLTEDLLVLSRARGGVLPVRLAEVALPALLDDARRRRCLLGSGHVEVAFHAQDCVVTVDPVWFRQAVDNLIDNAVRHTPPGGSVAVHAALLDGTCRLVVEDTGPGFDGAVIGAAFEPFARSRRVPADHGSAGLGLAVVSEIARAHGGRAWAENRPAGGARVTVSFGPADGGPPPR